MTPLAVRIERETGIKVKTAELILSGIRKESQKGRKREKALSGKDQKRAEKLQTSLKSLSSIEENVQKKLENIRAEKRIVLRELRTLGLYAG
ncbi:MAG: hypothetical protein HS115_08910 [Spirochaetales bacterium]|nr:hypothetical protein [Spirochaetales bacterium]